MDVAALRVVISANLTDLDRELKALDSKLDRTGASAERAGGRMSAGLTGPVRALGAAAGSLRPLEAGLAGIAAAADKAQAELRELSGTSVNPGVNTSGAGALSQIGAAADKLQTELKELAGTGVNISVSPATVNGLQAIATQVNGVEADVKDLSGTGVNIPVSTGAIAGLAAISQAADRTEADLKDLAKSSASIGVNVSVNRSATADLDAIARAADNAEAQLKDLSATPVNLAVGASTGLQEIARAADQVEGELKDLSRQGVNIPVNPATAGGLSAIAGRIDDLQSELKDLSRQGVNVPVNTGAIAGLSSIAKEADRTEKELRDLAGQGVKVPVDPAGAARLQSLTETIDRLEAKVKGFRAGINVPVSTGAVGALEAISRAADSTSQELKELQGQGVNVPVAGSAVAGLQAISNAADAAQADIKDLSGAAVNVAVGPAAAAGLANLSQEAEKAKKNIREITVVGNDIRISDGASAGLNTVGTAATGAKDKVEGLNNALKNPPGSKYKGLAVDFEKLGSSAQRAGEGFSKYVTAPIVAGGVASFAAYAKIDSLRRGLDSLNGSAAKTEAEFQQLAKIAKLPGLGLPEVAKAEVNLRTIGFTAEKAQKSISEFGNAVALVGKGREEFEGAIYGLQQLANTEFPLGEDLNIIKERIPQVTPLLKEAFGTARTEDLQKLGITSERVVNTIIEGLGRLPRATGGPQVAIENLADTFTVSGALIGKSLDQSFGITDKINAFSDTLSGAAESFSKLSPEAQATTASIVGLAAATGPVLFGIGGVIKLLPTMVTGFNAVRASVLSLNGALAVGVVGLAALAAYQGLELLNAPTDADRNIAEQKRYTEEFKKMGEARKGATEEETRVNIEAAKARQKAAEDELRAAAQNEARQIAQSQRVIEAIKEANEAIRARNGIDTDGGFSFSIRTQATNPADLKALKENEQKLKDYEAKLGTATERLNVFRARLKGVDEAAKEMGTTLETKPKVAAIADTKITDAIAEIENRLRTADKSFQLFGDAFDIVGEKSSILEGGIKNLLELGLKPADKAIQDFYARLGNVNLDAFKNLSVDIKPLETKDILPESNYKIVIDVDGTLQKVDAKGYELINIRQLSANDLGFGALLDMSEGLRLATATGLAFGDSLGANREQAQILEGTIRSLVENGFAPQSTQVQVLKGELDTLNQRLATTIETGPMLAEAARVMTDSFIDFGIGLASGSASAEQLATGVLTNIGDMLIGLGKSALMAGLGVEAIKAALGSLQGVGAIAAGAALIALGAAVKAGVKSAARGSAGGGGGASSVSSGPSISTPVLANTSNRPQPNNNTNVSNTARSNQGSSAPQRFEVYGKLVGEGRDLVAIVRNVLDEERRVGANG